MAEWTVSEKTSSRELGPMSVDTQTTWNLMNIHMVLEIP